MRKNYFPEKGFTLVEIIVAMGIGSILLIAIMQLTSTGNDAFKKSEARSKEQMDIRLAATYITESLRTAKFENTNKISFIKFSDPDPIIKNNEHAIYFGKGKSPSGEVIDTLIYASIDDSGKVIKKSLTDKSLYIDIDKGQDEEKNKSYFKWGSSDGNLVYFKITEKLEGYSIDGNVRLLNIDAVEIKKEEKPEEKYRGIKYNKKIETE